jgi:hypothetical protein
MVLLAAMPSAREHDDGEKAGIFQQAAKREAHVGVEILEE